jgi:hypothetical protein
MRFARLNKTIILFIAVSIAIHLCLLAILWLEGSFGLPNTNPFRIKVALNGAPNQKDDAQNLAGKANTEKTGEISNPKEASSATPGVNKNIEPPLQQSNGWGATKGPAHNYTNSISERSALQSRLNSERQQRFNTISGNVAQLIGRLNQEGISVGCALWINQSANKGYLKCNPENFTEQIKFYLAPANIEWVKQSDVQPPAMCIPIQIRDAHAEC